MKEYYLQSDPEIRDQQYTCISVLNTLELLINNSLKNVETFISTHFPSIEISCVEKLYFEYISKYTKNFIENTDKIPSIKIRGAYSTLKRATDTAKTLKKKMKGEPIDIHVVETGRWVPICSRSKYDSDLLNKTVYSYGKLYQDEKDEFNKRLVNKTLKEKTEEPKETLNKNDSVYNPTQDYLTEDPLIKSQLYSIVSVNGDLSSFTEELSKDLISSFIHSFVSTETEMEWSRNETKIQFCREYEVINSFQPCFKVRGLFISEEDARKKAKNFQVIDQTIDTLVARVGVWLPLVVHTDAIETEYDNSELNNIKNVLKDGEMKVKEARAKMIEAGYNPEDHTIDPDHPKPDDSKLSITVENTDNYIKEFKESNVEDVEIVEL